jgi:hypothetical protein
MQASERVDSATKLHTGRVQLARERTVRERPLGVVVKLSVAFRPEAER